MFLMKNDPEIRYSLSKVVDGKQCQKQQGFC